MLKTNLIKIINIFFLLLMLKACVPAVVGGAAAGGKSLYQDKTVGESLSDQTIWAKIRAALMKENIDNLVGNINVKVSEGRVLLTGIVKNREIMVKVVRICWQQDGVKEVINELKLDGEIQSGLKQYAQDTWVTTRVKSKLFFNKQVKSINYNIITIDGLVYVIGLANSQKELDVVIDSISQIGGVKEVISYVRVKKAIDQIEDSKNNYSTSIDEFNDKEVRLDDFEEEPKPQTSSKKLQNKPKTKQPRSDIFAEESLD